jgi:acetyl esterase/lipase
MQQYPYRSPQYPGTQVSYTIFEPNRDEIATAPVIFHFHGFGGTDKDWYSNYLTHLARRGYIAVFVQYHTPVTSPLWPYVSLPLPWRPQLFAIEIIQDALNRLNGAVAGDEPHVTPERDASGTPSIAFSGHSLGGIIALRLAAKAKKGELSIPVPKAIVLHDPSTDLWAPIEDWRLAAESEGGEPSTSELLGAIHPDTHLMVIMEDWEDQSRPGGTWDGKWNFSASAYNGVTTPYKNIMMPRSDYLGEPDAHDLTSNHFACSYLPPSASWPAPIPKGGDPVNALDYWACNRPSEATFNAAFKRDSDNAGYNPYCKPGAGACEDEARMGFWKNLTLDGTPDGVPMEVASMLIGSEVIEDLGR